MYDEILQVLKDTYQKSSLTKDEVARELNLSVSSINLRISQKLNLPEFIKLGETKNARVIFPITAVAKFLSNTIKIA